MSGELAGKVAIVTGGASGLGRGMAELFVAEGAKLVLADLNEEAGREVAAGLGEAALFARADVADADDVQALVDLAVTQFGGLDVMVNNAGIGDGTVTSFLDDDLTQFERIVGVNLKGVMLGSQRAGRHMAAHGGGSIVNVSSIAGIQAGLNVMTYRAVKAAVVHFTKSLAIDFAQHGIRVNVLCPGHIRTPLNAYAVPGADADTAERIAAAMQPVWDYSKPLKRQGTPADVAQAALWFASDRSAQVTGTVLPVDGGITAGDPVNHLEKLMAARAGALAEQGT